MLITFFILWGMVLGLNYQFAVRTKTDRKLSNGLKAMIIIPMAILGYILHPILIDSVSSRNAISIVMMGAMAGFAFINLRLIDRLRN